MILRGIMINVTNLKKGICNFSLLLFAVILSLSAGLIASTGNILVAVILLLLLIGIALIGKPNILLLLVILGALMADGLVSLYIPSLHIITWAIAVVAFVLGCSAILQYAWDKDETINLEF